MSGDRCELENVGQFGCHGRRGLAPAVVEPDMIESDLSLRLLEQCAEIARLDRHNRLTARIFLDDVQERKRCFRQGDIALVALLGPRQMRVALLSSEERSVGKEWDST